MDKVVIISAILLIPALLFGWAWFNRRGFWPALGINSACLFYLSFCVSVFLHKEMPDLGPLFSFLVSLIFVWGGLCVSSMHANRYESRKAYLERQKKMPGSRFPNIKFMKAVDDYIEKRQLDGERMALNVLLAIVIMMGVAGLFFSMIRG